MLYFTLKRTVSSCDSFAWKSDFTCTRMHVREPNVIISILFLFYFFEVVFVPNPTIRILLHIIHITFFFSLCLYLKSVGDCNVIIKGFISSAFHPPGQTESLLSSILSFFFLFLHNALWSAAQ